MECPPRLLDAIEMLNRRDYYDCHEVLEDELWRPIPHNSTLKNFYQGLLQIAVGAYHFQQQNPHGHQVLTGKGLKRLQDVKRAGDHETQQIDAWLELEQLIQDTEEFLAVPSNETLPLVRLK